MTDVQQNLVATPLPQPGGALHRITTVRSQLYSPFIARKSTSLIGVGRSPGLGPYEHEHQRAAPWNSSRRR